MKKILLFLLYILVISCKTDNEVLPEEVTNLEPKSKGEIIKHIYYTLAYSEADEQGKQEYIH